MADGKVIISTALDNTGIEKGVGSIKGSLGGLKNVIGKIGGIVAAAFSVRAIASFAKVCIDLGSDLQEVQNVVDVTFGALSKTINEFAQNAITQFGLSELAAKQYTSTMGTMLKSMGFNTDAVAEMSMELTGLAGDMASFYNLDAGDAFAKIRAGISGETEPLKQLGINLSVANLEAFALAQGITKSYSAMSQQEQAMLRYKYLLSVTADAQGDFARTSNSWANQIRILAEQFNSIKASIGQGLINALTPVLQFINTLVSSLQSAAIAFQTLTAALFGKATVQTEALTSSAEAGAEAEDALANSVGGAGRAAKESLVGFDELTTLQSDIGGGSGSGGSNAGVESTTVSSRITAEATVTDNISPKIQEIIDKMNQLIAPLKEIDLTAAKDAFSDLGKSVKNFGNMIAKHLKWAWFNILVPLSEWTIEDLAPASIEAFSSMLDLLTVSADALLSGLEKLWIGIQPIARWFGDTAIIILDEFNKRVDLLADVIEEHAPEIEQAFENIGTIIQSAWAIAEPRLTAMRDICLAIGQVLTELAGSKLGLFIDRVAAVSEILAGFSSGNWDNVWNGMAALVDNEGQRITDKIHAVALAIGIDFDRICADAEELGKDIFTFLKQAWKDVESIWETAAQWFQDMVITPIQSTFAPIMAWFDDLFGSIGQTAKDVFHNIGEFGRGGWQAIQLVWQSFSTWFSETVIQPVSGFFENLWENAKTQAFNAWEGIKSVFGSVTEFFEDIFTKAWQGIIDVFSPTGEIFVKIKDGIVSSFTGIVNDLIAGINSVVSKPFNGINNALRKIRSINILGAYPFNGLSTISVPKIPYLAQGAVLPANKPFLAMVGDQKHGTNIEAPLSTIQEAVAAVMGDQVSAMMAGFEALLEENRLLRQVVENIELGDTTIGQSANRYLQKLAVMRGGRL